MKRECRLRQRIAIELHNIMHVEESLSIVNLRYTWKFFASREKFRIRFLLAHILLPLYETYHVRT